MKIHKRLEKLENQFISEPTILFMADGKTISLTGPNDHLLTLLGVAREPERATPTQSTHLGLIQKCTGSMEPGGAHIIDLIRCFQHGSVDTIVKSGSSDRPAGTKAQSSNGGEPTSEKGAN